MGCFEQQYDLTSLGIKGSYTLVNVKNFNV